MNAGNIPASPPISKAPPPRGESVADTGNDGQENQDFAKLAGLSPKDGKADQQGDAAGKPADAEPGQDAPAQIDGDGTADVKAGDAEMKEQPAVGGQTTVAIAALFSQAAQSAARATDGDDKANLKGALADNLKPDEKANRFVDGKNGAVVSDAARTTGKQVAFSDVRTAKATSSSLTGAEQPANAQRGVAAGQQNAAPQVPAAQSPAANAVQNPLRPANAAVERAMPMARLAETGMDRSSMPVSITTSGLEAANRTTPAGVTVTNFWQFVAGNSGPAIVNTLPSGEATARPAQGTQNSVSMQVQLHPKTLGAVSVAISRVGNAVTVEIIAQTRQAEQLLRSDANNLVEAFRNADGKIEEVQVRIAAASETSAAGPRGTRDGDREAFGQAFGDSANQSSDDAPNDSGDRDDLPDDRAGFSEFGDRRDDETDAANHRAGLYL